MICSHREPLKRNFTLDNLRKITTLLLRNNAVRFIR